MNYKLRSIQIAVIGHIRDLTTWKTRNLRTHVTRSSILYFGRKITRKKEQKVYDKFDWSWTVKKDFL